MPDRHAEFVYSGCDDLFARRNTVRLAPGCDSASDPVADGRAHEPEISHSLVSDPAPSQIRDGPDHLLRSFGPRKATHACPFASMALSQVLPWHPANGVIQSRVRELLHAHQPAYPELAAPAPRDRQRTLISLCASGSVRMVLGLAHNLSVSLALPLRCRHSGRLRIAYP